MPFGLRNAASTFQRFVDQILIQCDNVFAYIDDILIYYSDNEEQHLQDIEKVLKILSDCELRIATEKCKFSCSEINFL